MTVQNMESKNYLDLFRGCLIGGAIGDALGYPVEFMHKEQIDTKYGDLSIQEYDLTRGKALVSDDTQMTLFTAAGLLAQWGEKPLQNIWQAYQMWYRMQMGQNPLDEKKKFHSWLADVPQMGENRAPGTTCLSAIRGGIYGTIDTPINQSKGCGGVMRVAPIGLFFNRMPETKDKIETVNEVAAASAALTHGHELGWLPAASLAHIINRLVYGRETLSAAIKDSIKYLREHYGSRNYTKDLAALLEQAISLSQNQSDDYENIKCLGEGWVAEETLAIAVYCALKYQDDISAALCAAVNHDGDSDSTGAVTGNILGAIWGYERIPEKWKMDLECRDEILRIADELWEGKTP